MRRARPLLGALAILLATGAALALAAGGGRPGSAPGRRWRGGRGRRPGARRGGRRWHADAGRGADAGREADAGGAAETGRGPRAGAAGTGLGGTTAVDPDELARISVRATPRVARRVERIRGLRFDRVPRPEVVTTSRLRRLTERELEREGAAKGVAGDEAVARITGLLGPDEQLEDAPTAGADLAAAAYDTRSDRLYVVSDAVVANRALVEFTLAHELDHALEDQRFGRRPGRADDDATLARIALGEGSATAVMNEYASRHLGAAELLAASAAVDPGTGDVPEFVVDQLLWTYLGGERFVDSLYRVGGDWSLVDYALRSRPPASTEQVLHPRHYLRDERPLAVRVGSRALRERGWRPAGHGLLGEYGTAQLLELGDDDPAARAAAAGWGGDRYELWRRDVAPADCEPSCREHLAAVLRWRWDSRRDATEFATAARTYVEDGLQGSSLGEDAWRVGDAAVALGGDRRATIFAFAPDPATARAIAITGAG